MKEPLHIRKNATLMRRKAPAAKSPEAAAEALLLKQKAEEAANRDFEKKQGLVTHEPGRKIAADFKNRVAQIRTRRKCSFAAAWDEIRSGDPEFFELYKGAAAAGW